jgi:hypothetical protein
MCRSDQFPRLLKINGNIILLNDKAGLFGFSIGFFVFSVVVF